MRGEREWQRERNRDAAVPQTPSPQLSSKVSRRKLTLSFLSPHPYVTQGSSLSPLVSLLWGFKMNGPGFVFHFTVAHTVCVYTAGFLLFGFSPRSPVLGFYNLQVHFIYVCIDLLFLKETFNFRVVLDFQKCCKDNRAYLHSPHIFSNPQIHF